MKKLAIFVIIVLCITFVVAYADSDSDYVFKEKISDTKYYPRENRVVTTTTYIDYENDKRFPTDDYRYGYTYRSTKEYRDSYKVYYDDDYWESERNRYDRNYDRWYDRNYDDKVYYYEKSPYSNRLIEKSCYTYPPRDRIFYIKC